VRILRGRGMQVWLPEREDHRSEQRLHLLRGSMQLLPHLQLQGRLSAGIGAALSLSTTGLQPDPGDARRSF
jgi:hypothetical protein